MKKVKGNFIWDKTSSAKFVPDPKGKFTVLYDDSEDKFELEKENPWKDLNEEMLKAIWKSIPTQKEFLQKHFKGELFTKEDMINFADFWFGESDCNTERVWSNWLKKRNKKQRRAELND